MNDDKLRIPGAIPSVVTFKYGDHELPIKSFSYSSGAPTGASTAMPGGNRKQRRALASLMRRARALKI